MDIGVISVRYARALLKSATDAKLDEQVYREMANVAKSYIEVPVLRQTIDNPMLEKSKKQMLLETAAGGSPSQLTQTFIASRKTSFVASSPPQPASPQRRNRRCARWWRARLKVLWSLRPR